MNLIKINSFCIIMLIILSLILSACSLTGEVATDTKLQNSKEIARDWIMNVSPTYTYDGKGLRDDSSNYVADCKTCYVHSFAFMTKHSGYGDRSDDIQSVMTMSHKIKVVTKDGIVVSAIIDGVWDDLHSREYSGGEVKQLKAMKAAEDELVKGANAVIQTKHFCRGVKVKCADYDKPVCAEGIITMKNDCYACLEEYVWYYEGSCEE